MENVEKISIDTIIKIIYKNILLIIITTFVVMSLAFSYAFINKSYKSEITLYGNDRLLNEIGETSQFSLNSFDFFKYIRENSKTIKNKGKNEEKFLKEMSKKLVAQTENNNPTRKIKYTLNDKNEIEQFSKEYVTLAQNYLLSKKNKFLENQIKIYEEQYKFLSENVDLRTTKDPLADTLITRLSYYKMLKNDSLPIVKMVSINVKSAINKKVIIILGAMLGLFLGLFVAFVKEFSKKLNWEEIKK